MKSVEEILKINSCEELFVNDINKSKEIFRVLAKAYHPDVCTTFDSTKVFTKINTLYAEAVSKIEKGIWFEKDLLSIQSKLGKKYGFKYLGKHIFELGTFYIGREFIVYIIEKQHKNFYHNAINTLKSFKYASIEMENEFKRYFPNIKDTFECDNGDYALVLEKTEDVFLLEDFYNCRKDLDPKHTAWIISRLCNIACFLRYNNLVHNGISLSNCFISPKYHTIMIYGGWWYTVKENEKMIGTQKCIYDIMPIKEKSLKIGSFKTDLESVKQIGRLLENDNTPNELKNWVKNASSGNAISEFESWNTVLDKTWGKRTFIKLNITEKEIYNL